MVGNMGSVISFYGPVQYKICRSEKKASIGDDFRRQFSTYVLQGSIDLIF